MTEKNNPQPKELLFTWAERDAFIKECEREAAERIVNSYNKNPAQIKVALVEEQIEQLQLKGLKLYEDITKVQREHRRRAYLPEIDIVHIYSGPFTALHRGMEFNQDTGARANINRSRDKDRDDIGLALVREVARSRLFSEGKENEAAHLDAEAHEPFFPRLVYNGQPSKTQHGEVLHENADFRAYLKKAATGDTPLISERYVREKVFVFDTVTNEEEKTVNIVHTGHQVRNLVQQLTWPDGALHNLYQARLEENRPLTIAAVSHNSGIIRIPFYFGLWRDVLSDQAGKPTINLMLYGVRDRSQETAREILKSELSGLALYAAHGSLSTEPYPYTIPTKG